MSRLGPIFLAGLLAAPILEHINPPLWVLYIAANALILRPYIRDL